MEKNKNKTNEQLLNEIAKLQAQITKLENAQTRHSSNGLEAMKAEERIDYYSRIFENSLNEIYLFDVHTMLFKQVNKAAQQNLGYSMEELQKMTPLDFKPEFTSESFANLVSPLRTGKKGKIVFETVHKRKDQSLYNVEVHLQTMNFEGRATFVAMILDITDRKHAEVELLQSEQKFKMLVTNLEEIIYLVDKDGIFTISEGKGLEKLGLKPGQVVGLSVFEFYKDYPEIIEGIRKALNGETNSIEVQIGPNYFTNWITPQFNLAGEVIGLIGLAINITDRKKAEKELRKSEEKFRNLLQSIPLPIVYVNNEGVFTFRNDRFIEIFGYTEEIVPDINEWWARAYPDDAYRQRVIQNWNLAVTKAFETGTDIESGVYQVTCMNGSVRDIIITGITINDDLLATLIDITELKLAEAKLIKEKEYSEELINALPGLFYQISHEGKFVNWNKDFEKVSGYSDEEMSKIRPIDLFEGEDKKIIAESIAKVFSHGSLDLESNLTSKTGRKVPYFFTGKRIMIDELPVLVGMGLDISELKEAENELKKHQEKLEELVKERTKDLETKNKELDNAMKVFVGRELTIRNLQERIRTLEGK